MENFEIIQILKLSASLMELHEENDFKIKSIHNALFNLEKVNEALSEMSLEKLSTLEGVGKGIASKINEVNTTGKLEELNQLLHRTPKGLLDIMTIKGLGPKKVKTIWKELSITTKEELLQACLDDKISKIKGFGAKTQDAIKQSLIFSEAQKDRFMYAEIELTAMELEKQIAQTFEGRLVSLTGEMRRKMEVIDQIQIIIGTDDIVDDHNRLATIGWLEQDVQASGPFTWRGKEKTTGCRTEIRFCKKEAFYLQLFLSTASSEHLKQEARDGKNIAAHVKNGIFASEEEIYKSLDMQYIEPEMREGRKEVDLARKGALPALVRIEDLKGILHNHSTYSDGGNTLEEMAIYCRNMGFEYFGISDHSKTAFYANGLKENQIEQQHKEIDRLNDQLAPFRIFKGIESDILNDGSLDYEDAVLSSFDFIVASIHSNLKMDMDKATQRLIKAIENPYTTILGHATGRLLLKREGYPIDHLKVIDACAANHVIIELNANPRRLDMDWRWLYYALEKGVMVSINPDAHSTQELHNMRFGLNVARKAGLTAKETFNALSLKEIESFFTKRRASAGISI